MALGAFAPDLYLVTETETPAALSFSLSLSNRESRRGASREPSATWSATTDVLSPVSALNRAAPAQVRGLRLVCKLRSGG